MFICLTFVVILNDCNKIPRKFERLLTKSIFPTSVQYPEYVRTQVILYLNIYVRVCARVFTWKQEIFRIVQPAGRANTHSTKFRFINSFAFVYTRYTFARCCVSLLLLYAFCIHKWKYGKACQTPTESKQKHAHTHAHMWSYTSRVRVCLLHYCGWNFNKQPIITGGSISVLFWFVLIQWKYIIECLMW